MRDLLLMARQKAERLTDEELAEEIAALESGKRKLRLPYEPGRFLVVNDLIVPMLRRVQQERRHDLKK